MKHFKLRKDLKTEVLGKTLYRIEATRDSKWAKTGDLGGFVEKEINLNGNAWVNGNAKVCDDARVCGNARVYGDAIVYGNALVYGDAKVCGDAKVEKYGQCVVVNNLKYNITVTLNHIKIGCEIHSIEHWKKEIRNIGKKHGYTKKEIDGTILILKGILLQRSN